ncbi:hypothetical protein [Tsukamurella pseudospumae]|uniref:Uncharacterized protein n=1 Tax=Tsukamurella pseudospumae TaxID=239498 RepID=A0A138AE49_9ACTN|nr:hypothetical protein [Tsukamurella pseudospumae]KXP08734.1 hypothetical protein AXK60_08650 [Tsukamurella pseudospumae]
MAESEGYRRRIALLAAVDADMMAVHERVLTLMQRGVPVDAFEVQMQVSMRLEQLAKAVDEVLGYMELHPAELAERADRVVLVDRSGPEPLTHTYPLEDWREHGPKILTAALRLWGAAGGRARLSGSALRGRGTVTTERGSYTACAWYAADAGGHAIWPETEQGVQQ